MLGRHLLLVGFLSSHLVVPLAASQQPDNRRPIPRESFRGDTLTVPQQNFSIRGPKNWSWTQQTIDVGGTPAEAFVATAPTEDSALVVATPDMPFWRFNDPSFAEGFAEGMLGTLPAGWTVADISVISKPIPAASSASMYRVRLAGPDSAVVYQMGYLVRGKPVYLIIMNSPDASEPLPLRQSVETFRLLDQRRAALRLPAALVIFGRLRSLFIGLLVAFVLLELVLRVRAHSNPPPAPEGLTLLSRVLILLGVAFALIATTVEISPSEPTPGAYAVGAVTGVLLISSGIAYVAYGRKAKRNLNKFARLFCALCFVTPWISAAGQAAR